MYAVTRTISVKRNFTVEAHACNYNYQMEVIAEGDGWTKEYNGHHQRQSAVLERADLDTVVDNLLADFRAKTTNRYTTLGFYFPPESMSAELCLLLSVAFNQPRRWLSAFTVRLSETDAVEGICRYVRSSDYLEIYQSISPDSWHMDSSLLDYCAEAYQFEKGSLAIARTLDIQHYPAGQFKQGVLSAHNYSMQVIIETDVPQKTIYSPEVEMAIETVIARYCDDLLNDNALDGKYDPESLSAELSKRLASSFASRGFSAITVRLCEAELCEAEPVWIAYRTPSSLSTRSISTKRNFTFDHYLEDQFQASDIVTDNYQMEVIVEDGREEPGPLLPTRADLETALDNIPAGYQDTVLNDVLYHMPGVHKNKYTIETLSDKFCNRLRAIFADRGFSAFTVQLCETEQPYRRSYRLASTDAETAEPHLRNIEIV